MAKMSDKTKRAINAGRRRAGLKPIRFGAKKRLTIHQKRFPSLSKKEKEFARWQAELND